MDAKETSRLIGAAYKRGIEDICDTMAESVRIIAEGLPGVTFTTQDLIAFIEKAKNEGLAL